VKTPAQPAAAAAAAVPAPQGAGSGAAPAPGAKQGAGEATVSPEAAVQAFMTDHPEFMRVLNNPKKCLSDPRVKSMFMKELQNYPAVKAFIASKGN